MRPPAARSTWATYSGGTGAYSLSADAVGPHAIRRQLGGRNVHQSGGTDTASTASVHRHINARGQRNVHSQRHRARFRSRQRVRRVSAGTRHLRPVGRSQRGLTAPLSRLTTPAVTPPMPSAAGATVGRRPNTSATPPPPRRRSSRPAARTPPPTSPSAAAAQYNLSGGTLQINGSCINQGVFDGGNSPATLGPTASSTSQPARGQNSPTCRSTWAPMHC